MKCTKKSGGTKKMGKSMMRGETEAAYSALYGGGGGKKKKQGKRKK